MKVKISFISDLHAKHGTWEMQMLSTKKLTEFDKSDIIVFCGDLSSNGYQHEIENFLVWFNNIVPTAKKFYIAGNHDFFYDSYWFGRTDVGARRHQRSNNLNEKYITEVLAKYPDLVYLNDSSFEYLGLKFWGSPITPWFHDWAFNRLSNEIKPHWDLIPNDTDVLITHGPAYGFGDLLHPRFQRYNEKPNVGCPLLLKEIQERIKPSIHAFGHIHEAYGIYPPIEDPNIETLYINASSLNHNYQPTNPPITVEIDNKTKKIKVI